MSRSVIQGYFPHGVKVPAHPHGAPSPRWVQERIAAVGRAAQPKKVSPPRASFNGNATALPWQLARIPDAGGQPLPADVRRKMESLFGQNFSDVRIHIGTQAAAIGALAFTQGSHIHFAPGQYDPATPKGRQVLGHELAHVVQQRTGRVRNPFTTGTAVVDDRMLEAEAERMARRAANAPSAPVVQGKAAPHAPPRPNVIQRAVGFEFETGWYVEKVTERLLHAPAYAALRKKDVVYRGNGFRVEADEAAAEGQAALSELEFVIDPPINDSYFAENDVRAIMNRVVHVATQLEQAAARGRQFIWQTTEGKFRITAPGDRRVVANPQVTAGIRLNRIGALAAAHEPSGTRATLVSNSGIVDDLRAYHQRATEVVEELDGTEQLAGLLTLICHYLHCWASGNPDAIGSYTHAFEYIKMGPAFMARTDFAAMYRSLPQQDRDLFRNSEDFLSTVDRCTNLDLSKRVIERGVRLPTREEMTMEFLAQRHEELVAFPQITRAEWIISMVEGIDRLSGALRPDLFEGMGALGTKMDRVGVIASHTAPIIEFRKATARLHQTGWVDFAVNAYRYVFDLNNPGERDLLQSGRAVTIENYF